VITNNLSSALEAGEAGFEIILLGGTYQPRSQSVAGRFTIENLGHIYADQAFMLAVQRFETDHLKRLRRLERATLTCPNCGAVLRCPACGHDPGPKP